MRGNVLFPVCTLALVLFGCTSNGSAPAPAPGACAAGETAGEANAFCYKVPGGFSPRGEPIKRQGWVGVAYASEDRAAVTFILRDLGGFDSAWKALQGNSTSSRATDVKEEEIAGGKGKILTYTTPEKDPRVVISVMLRGAKNALECEAEYHVSAPKPELVDACKSIREP